jgi:starvation-inducible DNA-binding protein
MNDKLMEARMSTSGKHAPVRSALTEKAKKITGDALQGALVDLLDLSLVAKQAHWNVVGPRFRSIHLQLDEVVDLARTAADTVAERAAAIGVSPDGRAGTVAKESGVATFPTGYVSDTEVVKTLITALESVVVRMRKRVEATAEPDPVSQDVLIGITADVEKYAWMFQAESIQEPTGGQEGPTAGARQRDK